jgi:hypothetical protein
MKRAYEIKKKKDGRYFVEFWNEEKRHRYTLTETNQANRTKQAEMFIEKIKNGEKVNGRKPKPAPTFIDHLWTAYEAQTAGLSDSTKSNYKTVLKGYLSYLENHPNEQYNSPLTAQNYLNTHDDKANSYYNKILSQLKTLFERAIYLELITKNPFRFIKRKKETAPVPETILFIYLQY